jgi:hypothetical protein
VGHPALCRQEAGRDDVGIDAARASLARDDAVLGQLARWRAIVLLGLPVTVERVRTEGKQRPVRSAKLTKFWSVQCR